LVKPFKEEKVVMTYSKILQEDTKELFYPHVPDGKFTAFRKSALKKVGMFDEKTFFTGGEDIDIWLKLKKIGKVLPVNTLFLHSHPFYKGSFSIEKRKQNGSINGTLFRVWGIKNPKWFKAILMCFRYPLSYGKYFLKAFFSGKQKYRRKE